MEVVEDYIATLIKEYETCGIPHGEVRIDSDKKIILNIRNDIFSRYVVSNNVSLEIVLFAMNCHEKNISLDIELHRRSTLKCTIISECCERSNISITTKIIGEGVNSDIRNFFYGRNYDEQVLKIRQDHEVGFSKSSVIAKTVLDDFSKSTFDGDINISATADHSDAKQQNNNLIFSTTAQAISIPNLKIFNNNVQCSHGATVGPVDDDVIFYMTGRGIDISTCKNLITEGVFLDVIG